MLHALPTSDIVTRLEEQLACMTDAGISSEDILAAIVSEYSAIKESEMWAIDRIAGYLFDSCPCEYPGDNKRIVMGTDMNTLKLAIHTAYLDIQLLFVQYDLNVEILKKGASVNNWTGWNNKDMVINIG